MGGSERGGVARPAPAVRLGQQNASKTRTLSSKVIVSQNCIDFDTKTYRFGYFSGPSYRGAHAGWLAGGVSGAHRPVLLMKVEGAERQDRLAGPRLAGQGGGVVPGMLRRYLRGWIWGGQRGRSAGVVYSIRGGA